MPLLVSNNTWLAPKNAMFSSFLGTSHDWQETGLCFSVFNTVPVTYGPCWFYSGAPGAWERKLWPHLLLRSNRVFFLPPHFQEHVCGDAILNSYLLLPYSHSLWGVWGVSHGMTLLIRTESSPSWMTGFLLEQMRMTVSRHHRTIVRNTVIPRVMILPASPDLIVIVFRGTYSPVKNHTQW